jgi:hypothetical protein
MSAVYNLLRRNHAISSCLERTAFAMAIKSSESANRLQLNDKGWSKYLSPAMRIGSREIEPHYLTLLQSLRFCFMSPIKTETRRRHVFYHHAKSQKEVSLIMFVLIE